jgi:hypothetical protein
LIQNTGLVIQRCACRVQHIGSVISIN